jgi:hypothetical protein
METITTKQVEIPAAVKPKLTRTLDMFGEKVEIYFLFAGIGKNGVRHISQKRFVPATATEAKAFLYPSAIKGMKTATGWSNPVGWHRKQGLVLADADNAQEVLDKGGIVLNEDGTISFVKADDKATGKLTTYKLTYQIVLFDGELINNKSGITTLKNVDNDSEASEVLPFTLVSEE